MGSTRLIVPTLPVPRPLRITLTSPARQNSLYDVRPPAMTSKDKGNSKVLRHLVTKEEVDDIVSRLTRPTVSSRLKSSRMYPVMNYVDMQFYQWNRMPLYGDYQGQIFGKLGDVRPSFTKNGSRRPAYVDISHV
jgi:hypothetical protein